MMMVRKLTVAAVLAGALVMGAAAPASAGGEVLDLVCASGTYHVVSNGNGAWTPARELGSTRVFIPTSFGEFSGTFTPSDGSDPITFTDPAISKTANPQAHNGKATFEHCTFSVHFEAPEGTFVGSGSVSGWATR
jgi:hypothetical protein